MGDVDQVPPGVDPATPSPARMYDYMLGGTHNFQADQGAEASLTYIGSWGAEDPELADSDGSRALYCAVARRP